MFNIYIMININIRKKIALFYDSEVKIVYLSGRIWKSELPIEDTNLTFLPAIYLKSQLDACNHREGCSKPGQVPPVNLIKPK